MPPACDKGASLVLFSSSSSFSVSVMSRLWMYADTAPQGPSVTVVRSRMVKVMWYELPGLTGVEGMGTPTVITMAVTGM